LYDYGAQPISLILNENTVSFSVSPGESASAKPKITFRNIHAKIAIENNVISNSAHTNINSFYRLSDKTLVLNGNINFSDYPNNFTVAVRDPVSFFWKYFKFIFCKQWNSF